MALDLRQDERQWLRYHPDELVATMRAAEAWALRVAGVWLLMNASRFDTAKACEDAKHLGSIMAKISDARMEYLGSDKYETSLEETVAGSSFDVISRVFAGELVPPDVVETALDTMLASMAHIDTRTGEAGFLNPTRLESVLARGDSGGR